MAVAAFPSIEPSARSWTPGSQPVQSFTSLSGYERRVLLGTNRVGTTLTVSFQNLTEAKFLLITDHYATALGSYETFSLPAEIFAGVTDYSSITPSGFSWRYAGAPSVDWVAPGVANVGVAFIAVQV